MLKLEKIIEVALSLNIEPSKEVLEQLEKEFESIIFSLEQVKNIDVSGVEPMVRIDESFTTFLREDIVKSEENISKVNLLKNSVDSTKDFIKIERVVHD